MKKIFGRMLALLLTVCILLSLLLPTVYAQEPSAEEVIYRLYMEEYRGQYLWYSTKDNLREKVAADFADPASEQNWCYEQMSGSVIFGTNYLETDEHLEPGVGKKGAYFAIRIKSPGSGIYDVNLKQYTCGRSDAADKCDIFIFPAPAEPYASYNDLKSAITTSAIMSTTFSHAGEEGKPEEGLVATECTGSYAFEADKEYIIAFYAIDVEDANNPTTSTWMYMDRIIMTKTGELELPKEDVIRPDGVTVSDEVINLCKPGVFTAVTEVSGHDYLYIPIYGKKMLVYDLDTWEKVDEIWTGVPNPRGTTVDADGNIWVAGDSWTMCKYDPNTGVSELTPMINEVISDAGSAFSISFGEDGCLYFGTYSTGHVAKYDPQTRTFTDLGRPCEDASYASAVVMKDGFIYASMHGDKNGDGTKTHEIIKMDAKTNEVVGRVDVSGHMANIAYLTNIDFLADGVLAGCVGNNNMGLIVVDTQTMKLIPAEDFGVEGPIIRAVSEEKNGKTYFATKDGLCEYDIASGKATLLDGGLTEAITGLRANVNSFVTIDDPELPGESIITYGAVDTIKFYNLQTKKVVLKEGLVGDTEGAGQTLRALTSGLPGSNELYLGAYDTNKVAVYNTETDAITRIITTNGSQTDAMCWYKGELYAGNYNVCTLSLIDLNTNTAQPLFALNDSIFDQARIHTITAGDDKVFAGTTPDQNKHGGFIVWYDLESKLTYVAAGPEPEDVYYADTSVESPVWYAAATKAPVTDFKTVFDQDINGDKVNDKFKGTISEQTVNNLVYHDGLLYGTSSAAGGTNTSKRTDLSAVLFVYDVENMQMLATYDLCQTIDGLAAPIYFIAGIAADPQVDSNGKFWGVVSETLFSFTFDAVTKQFQVTEELSFDKTTYWEGTSRHWFPRPILFKDGYLYVAFDFKGGLCKVNLADTGDYEQLLSDFDATTDIPFDYTLGEDGNLYYVTGISELRVLKLDATDEDWAKGEAIDEQIAQLGETITTDSDAAVKAAREAYNALSYADRGLVKNAGALLNAEAALVQAKIDGIGEVTLESAELLAKIRADYDALTVAQTEKVTNYVELVAAEKQLRSLQQAAQPDPEPDSTPQEEQKANAAADPGTVIAIAAAVVVVIAAAIVLLIPGIRKKLFKR